MRPGLRSQSETPEGFQVYPGIQERWRWRPEQTGPGLSFQVYLVNSLFRIHDALFNGGNFLVIEMENIFTTNQCALFINT